MATETVERAGVVTDADPETSGAAAFDLLIPDLQIRGFRGIDNLSIPGFSQVTLLAGMNGIGKTTVLEALGVFASRGSGTTLTGILSDRRELDLALDEEGDPTIVLDWESLFFGRSPGADDTISISIKGGDESLTISVATHEEIEKDGVEMAVGPLHAETTVLKTSMNEARRYVPMMPGRGYRSLRRKPSFFETGYPTDLNYETVGPDVLKDDQLARMWDSLALSEELRNVTDSLTEMYGRQISGIAMTGDEWRSRQLGRRAMIRIVGSSRPVPLKSLGDGAMRISGNLMAVSRLDTSLVLVDEIENGVHHSIQRQFWNTMISAAARNGTQLVATTHSWDCVEAFAHAAVENKNVDCSLIRLDDIGDELTIAIYDESNLLSATESGIEVR